LVYFWYFWLLFHLNWAFFLTFGLTDKSHVTFCRVLDFQIQLSSIFWAFLAITVLATYFQKMGNFFNLLITLTNPTPPSVDKVAEDEMVR
jgi:hypothetical protein